MKKVFIFVLIFILILFLDSTFANACYTLTDKIGYNIFTDSLKLVSKYFIQIFGVIAFGVIFLKPIK